MRTRRRTVSIQEPHLLVCNYHRGPVGGPGCICLVVNRKEYASLLADAEALLKLRHQISFLPGLDKAKHNGTGAILVPEWVIGEIAFALAALPAHLREQGEG